LPGSTLGNNVLELEIRNFTTFSQNRKTNNNKTTSENNNKDV